MKRALIFILAGVLTYVALGFYSTFGAVSIGWDVTALVVGAVLATYRDRPCQVFSPTSSVVGQSESEG